MSNSLGFELLTKEIHEIWLAKLPFLQNKPETIAIRVNADNSAEITQFEENIKAIFPNIQFIYFSHSHELTKRKDYLDVLLLPRIEKILPNLKEDIVLAKQVLKPNGALWIAAISQDSLQEQIQWIQSSIPSNWLDGQTFAEILQQEQFQDTVIQVERFNYLYKSMLALQREWSDFLKEETQKADFLDAKKQLFFMGFSLLFAQTFMPDPTARQFTKQGETHIGLASLRAQLRQHQAAAEDKDTDGGET